MAQVPAVPKLTRAWHLLRAEWLGQIAPTPGMAASENAALTLRAKSLEKSHADHLTFLIPLVGPHHVSDWDAVTHRLTATLGTFQRQTNPNWTVAICCQERPNLPDDPRISYLPFTDPAAGNDKWRKLRLLNEALPDLTETPGYVMSFDADDLLHPDTVDEMLTRQASGGYLVQSGLVMDVSTQEIALADTRSLSAPMRKPFWKLCGSCAALFHDPREPASTAFLTEMTQHEHRMFPYLARLAGQPLTPLSYPAVLYMLNHGENFGARRGRVGYKTRFVQKYHISDAQRLTRIRADFELD
ncbi:hypothetical protein [Marivita hallyeonensis]|uniref:Glycosyl transferase family 2 n=1 Tax=Marivita hallyeonensis TaxID=996342 RepID=A0A1M5PE27_9RHOB|nr:hypothetical protein [Marivita hallyeonensis]SHH00034.1 hypothetical protein SAMN05443551_1263 [Marivita hallyeonensis]